MAEAVLELVLDNLSSLVQKELGLLLGFEKDFKSFSSMLTTIKATLEDTEEKQFTNKAIKDWLLKLKDAAYVLDDILDECATKAVELEYKGSKGGLPDKVQSSCLSSHEIEIMHEVKGMSRENALELLRWMAFKSYKVPSSYEEILNRAVVYASGLPLAIEVVGSNLFGKSISECESTLDKYQRIPNEDIQKILKVSFDALDEEQQSVFLDIACFFKGCILAKVEEILKLHYGYCIKSHIGGLVDKSLIKISECYTLNEVTLHDLLEVMGKEIVRKESPKEPEKRSRLWCRGDIIQILQENKGTSKIEMIYLNSPSMDLVIDWNGKAFKKMTNLKTLIIKNVSFTKDPKYLPSSLRVLKLNGCSTESLSSCIGSKEA
ncbi:disease resistance protein RUN1-like [Medicago truncatula]|uniref:disease resistance protein RUN1-like n=1 Tax=Medicago truncatula TaxID=3880 RepID=UPI001966F821|nr:disease resistance protein RUN1-like [Medicago truncatula]